MSGVPIRVMVEDAWDQLTLDVPLSTSVADLKSRALALTHTVGEPAEFQVKFRGAELLHEARSLADAGLLANASVIVMSRRRRPIR
jgi:hypothetical protein